jgi:hypothetical protein
MPGVTGFARDYSTGTQTIRRTDCLRFWFVPTAVHRRPYRSNCWPTRSRRSSTVSWTRPLGYRSAMGVSTTFRIGTLATSSVPADSFQAPPPMTHLGSPTRRYPLGVRCEGRGAYRAISRLTAAAPCARGSLARSCVGAGSSFRANRSRSACRRARPKPARRERSRGDSRGSGSTPRGRVRDTLGTLSSRVDGRGREKMAVCGRFRKGPPGFEPGTDGL